MTNTLEGEFVPLDENPDWVTHELLGDLKDIRGHRGGKEDDLSFGGKELEDVVDGVLESGGQHLIGFIEAEHLDRIGLQGSAVDHVEHSSGGSDDDVRSIAKLGHVFTNSGAADTCVTVDIEVITESDDNLLDLLSELTGGGEDEGLGLLDCGVDLLSSARL